MAIPIIIYDNSLVWLTITKIGSPPAWVPGTNYKLGDVVVPTNPQPTQLNLAFQVIGFRGRTGPTQPVLPVIIDDTIIDTEVEWTCVDPNSSPPQLPYNQYYFITPTITVQPVE